MLDMKPLHQKTCWYYGGYFLSAWIILSQSCREVIASVWSQTKILIRAWPVVSGSWNQSVPRSTGIRIIKAGELWARRRHSTYGIPYRLGHITRIFINLLLPSNGIISDYRDVAVTASEASVLQVPYSPPWPPLPSEQRAEPPQCTQTRKLAISSTAGAASYQTK